MTLELIGKKRKPEGKEIPINMKLLIKKNEKEKMCSKYIGESSRSGYERFKQHREDFNNLNPGSHMLKHYLQCHQNIKMEEMVMQPRIIKTYRSSFEREIGESVWINAAIKEGIELLNSKNEYNRCSIPRLGLTLDKEQKIEEYKDKQAELEIKRKINELREKLRYDKNEIRKNKRRKKDKNGEYETNLIKMDKRTKMNINSARIQLKIRKDVFMEKIKEKTSWG